MKKKMLTCLLALILLYNTAICVSAAHPVPDLTTNGSITFEMVKNGLLLDGGKLNLCKVGNIQEDDGNYSFVLIDELKALGISVKYDNADNRRPGFKFADYELKGVPVRLVLGARDIENGTIEVMRRDTLEKITRPLEGITEFVKALLDEMQLNIYHKALKMREENTRTVDTYEEFKQEIEKGGFILAHWDGTPETEELIKAETKATIRCIPLQGDKTPGKCIVTGKPSAQRVLFARAY